MGRERTSAHGVRSDSETRIPHYQARLCRGRHVGGSLVDLAEVVALAESGRVRPHVQHFAFDQIEQAYHALHEGEVEGRAVILPGKSGGVQG